MSLLLDTHVIIWLTTDVQRVPSAVLDRIVNETPVCVSVVSAWEYGIKRARRREEFPLAFDELIANGDLERIGLEFELHRYSQSLPHIHRDPFDRMLIAQAISRGLTLVTQDSQIPLYDVPTLW